jgi:hypothetical protein
VKQGVREVVVEIEQLRLRSIDGWSYIDDEWLQQSDTVVQRAQNCTLVRQSRKQRASEGECRCGVAALKPLRPDVWA